MAGEADNGPEALRLVRQAPPGEPIDVVLMDIAMPQRDGLDVLKQLKKEFPRLPVLMLSTYPDRQYAVRSLKLGAAGYLNKSADSRQLIEAVRKVAQGKLFITPSVAEHLAEQLTGSAAAAIATTVRPPRPRPRCTSGCRTASTRCFACWPAVAAWGRSPSSSRSRPTRSAPTGPASSTRLACATTWSWRCMR